MKQFALCVVLMAALGVNGKAQDRKSGPAVPATAPTAVSDDDEEPTQVPPSLPAGQSEPRCYMQTRVCNHTRSQFSPCLESSSPSTLLTPCRHENPLQLLRDIPAAKPEDDASADTGRVKGFQWSQAINQSMVFLGVQHGYALTQPKTRRDLKGSFFKDYVRSVKSLHGWEDGGRFFTNYLAHPMQGSLLGFIQVQNDPKAMNLRFGKSKAYWRSRLKALAWSAAWSTQFEIGPVSQASIGNVGLHGKQTYVDLVITPIAGLGLLVAEDALDKHLVQMIERNSGNFYVKIASRVLLNPTRTVANLLRFKKPWHRDKGLR